MTSMGETTDRDKYAGIAARGTYEFKYRTYRYTVAFDGTTLIERCGWFRRRPYIVGRWARNPGGVEGTLVARDRPARGDGEYEAGNCIRNDLERRVALLDDAYVAAALQLKMIDERRAALYRMLGYADPAAIAT